MKKLTLIIFLGLSFLGFTQAPETIESEESVLDILDSLAAQGSKESAIRYMDEVYQERKVQDGETTVYPDANFRIGPLGILYNLPNREAYDMIISELNISATVTNMRSAKKGIKIFDYNDKYSVYNQKNKDFWIHVGYVTK